MTDGDLTRRDLVELRAEVQRVALYTALVQARAADSTAMVAEGLLGFLKLPAHDRVVGYSVWLTYVAAGYQGNLTRIQEMARFLSGAQTPTTSGGRTAAHVVDLVKTAVADAIRNYAALQPAVDAIAFSVDPHMWADDDEMHFAHYLLGAASYVEGCRILSDAHTGRATAMPIPSRPHHQWVARFISYPLSGERVN